MNADEWEIELPRLSMRVKFAGARFAVPREPPPPLEPPTPEQVAAYRRLRNRTVETRPVRPDDDVRPDHIIEG